MAEPSLPSAEADDYKYWGFISYSHQDEAWGEWLHRGIETYRVPRALVGRHTEVGDTPRRLLPIFRDRDELPVADDLGAKIREALRLSRFLIVICSPRAAASRWVNEEIKIFKTLGRERRVLSLIVDGEPNASERPESGLLECFPPALRFRVGEDGELTTVRAEPLAGDLREGKDGKTNARLKLLAGILDVGFDTLRRREARRRRRKRSVWAAGLVVASCVALLGFIALADWSNESARFPGAEAIKNYLDRHELSLFRPVHTDAEIRRAAAELRRALVQPLGRLARDHAIMPIGPKPDISVWVMTQSLSALLQAPEATDEDRIHSAQALRLPFVPGFAVEETGVKYGWMPSRVPATMAEPSLWTTVALSLVHSRCDTLDDLAREEARRRLTYAQATTRIYHPLPDGGWNTFPNQEDPAQHSTYTTSLALLALLEAHAAEVPWEESEAERDTLLSAAANWLVQHFESGDRPGWRVGPDVRNETNGELSLYVYRELLWAEGAAGFVLPESIRETIPRHLLRLGERRLDFPSATSGYFAVRYRNHKDQFFNENPGTEFPWHPAAIGCAVRWLSSAGNRQVPNEVRYRVRRVLGHLVVDLKDEVLQRLRPEHPSRLATYQQAELLYSLSLIPLPGE